MRVLILGSGAKDHAIAYWFSQSEYISSLFVAPGNAGTKGVATNLSNVNPTDPNMVEKAVKENKIDLVFIGTEAPLLSGVKERMEKLGIDCYAASKEALQLEDNKAFSRAFTSRHSIPVPPSTLLEDKDSLVSFLDKNEGKKFTIKSNSMTPSRVMLTSSEKNALVSYSKILFSKGPVLLEDYVEGTHVTCTAFTDNSGCFIFPLANEYVNVSHTEEIITGGMGAIAPIPLKDDIRQKIRQQIVYPTLDGMREEGLSYKGVLTFSIVITPENNPILVDYHVRLNDPATQAMVPLLRTDAGEVLLKMKENKVRDVKLEISDDCAVSVVIASPGYPNSPELGVPVKPLTNALLMNIKGKPYVFVGAINKNEDGVYVTTGGRCLTVTGVSPTLEEANRLCYGLIKERSFAPLWYRDDIGNKFFH